MTFQQVFHNGNNIQRKDTCYYSQSKTEACFWSSFSCGTTIKQCLCQSFFQFGRQHSLLSVLLFQPNHEKPKQSPPPLYYYRSRSTLLIEHTPNQTILLEQQWSFCAEIDWDDAKDRKEQLQREILKFSTQKRGKKGTKKLLLIIKNKKTIF